jgi:phage N-6-adenine-methyltransferase
MSVGNLETTVNDAMLSSKSVEWSTPQELFDELDREFHFTLDVCATPENAKCERFFTKEQDGLRQSWSNEVIWLNPPYGRQIDRWIRRAYIASACADSTVVCLIPARTDTSYWHEYVMKGDVRFLRGRIYFESPGKKRDRAPFPSAVVIFRPPGVSAGNQESR